MDPQHRVIRLLSSSRSYPHPVGRVVHRETHVSHVFLAGSFAYKLKKAVRFPFVDATSIARRRRFCRLEVQLNKRLAPDLYLGVLPIAERAGRLHLGGSGRAVDWVVKMRRLPDEQMLDRAIATRRVSRAQMLQIVERLLAFFRNARRSRVVAQHGQPERIAQLVLGNVGECRPFVGTLIAEGDHQCIQTALWQFLLLNEPLLHRRISQQRIIDGHGDLRGENICLTDPVTIFDCVEYQPAFRYGDMISDLSFLLMDLTFRGRGDLASLALKTYQRRMRDPEAGQLVPFYACHRSLVRGKVAGLGWRQHPRSPAGRRMHQAARNYFQLAVRYATRCAKPRLIIVGGLVGTGKSVLANRLAGALNAAWLRTDEIRLCEFARYRRRDQGFGQGLYAPWVSVQVYQRLVQHATQLLKQGRSVVCDGTFAKRAAREILQEQAHHYGATVHFFECVVPAAVARHRIRRRLARGRDASEARPGYYDKLAANVEPVRGWTAQEWTRLSTAGSPEATYQRAVTILQRAWGSAAR